MRRLARFALTCKVLFLLNLSAPSGLSGAFRLSGFVSFFTLRHP